MLLTGARGYVDGCLLRELERQGTTVRALSRSPEKLAGGAFTEVVAGDVTDPDSLAAFVERLVRLGRIGPG